MAPVCAPIEQAARAGSIEHAAAQADCLEREFAAASGAGAGDPVTATLTNVWAQLNEPLI